MDLKNTIILISAAINLFLGFFIYLKGKRKLVNGIYSLIAFSVAYWALGMILYRAAATVEYSILWGQVLYTAPIFIVGSFLFFTYVFPEDKDNIKRWLKIIILVICGIVFYLTLFTNTIITNVNFNSGAEKTIIFGNLYFVYSLFISGFFIWGYINLLRKRNKSVGVFRAQITYVFWGTFLASTLAMVTNLILPTFSIFYFNWLGQVLTLIMVALIAYAIIIHRLMDIKLVLRRSFVYVSSIVVIAVPAFLILYFADKFLSQYIVYVSLLVLIGAVSVFTPIKNYYYRIANKYFFSSLYDSGQVIAKLSDGLRSTLDVQQVYNLISNTLVGSIRAKAVAVLNYDESNDQYVLQYNNGFELNGRKLFGSDKDLHKNFIAKSKSMVVEEIKSVAYKEYKAIIDLLTSINAAVIVPLNIKDEVLGVIVLGQKESGDMYNDEDLHMLEVIASQAAIAIKNAQLYDETKRFSITLQAEVEHQTKELKRANEELQKLDKAKSDFISIASHQLRTPLTAIKGFTSMILEGTYGTLTDVLRDKLEKILESSERLIRLVKDLLDLSHMEGGKMEFNFAKVDFDAMVKSVVEELKQNAERKKLKFTWKTPAKEFWVWADEQKLRQVVMNLIDNAIKYTRQGSVDVLLEHQDGQIVMSVRDTGMGLQPGESNRLFQKFARGSEASLYHTEGAGIGLYVARKIIDEHQGRVWVESKGEGLGSTFYIKLPEYRK